MNNNRKKNTVQCPKCNTQFEVESSEPKTGLYWEGKRTEVERISLPFQVIETVNESRATREELKKVPLLRDMGVGKIVDTGWKNKLIWGDNKYVMSSLLDEFAGKIDLIYIDPPFYSGADQTIKIPIGEESKILKEPSMVEEYAYRNTWNKDVDGFCQHMYERLLLIRDLLSPNGSLYVRFDWHYGHYVKLLLDEVFDIFNFKNEIVLNRIKKSDPNVRKHNAATDSLYFYAFGDYTLNLVKKRIEKREGYWHAMDSQGQGEPRRFFGKLLVPPAGRHWTFNQEKIDKMIEEGKIRLNPKTNKPEYWIGEREELLIDSNWTDIPGYSFSTPYPTENAEQVLERVILASSNEGNLVADFFCGSGTTGAVAEKLHRRWVMCDIGRFAIHTTRKRLLEIDGCRPFEVLNLGKYERQYWQGITFGDKKRDTKKTISEYLQFIVKLYQAEPITGFRYLHGKKGRKMVSVGSVDAPVTLREIQEALEECKQAGQKELDILGWEWEMGLHDVVESEAKIRGVDLHLRTIPREVMDPRAVDSGDIQFFELAYLDAKVIKDKRGEFVVELKDFVIQNTDLIPEEIRKKIKKWSDYIDYWAVDWDYRDDTFHNQWQLYRTRKDRTLQLKSDSHKYDKKGEYTIMIKVIDIFGNDTTRVEEVTV